MVDGMMKNKIYTVFIDKIDDGDELCFSVPDELMEATGWGEGTELEWVINPDNTISITERRRHDSDN